MNAGSLRLQGALRLFLDANALPTSLWVGFGGAILLPEPGQPELPLFAFPAETLAPDVPDPGPPEIALALLGVTGAILPNPGPPELPLFAFASPGTRVGTLRIEVSRVPETPPARRGSL